MRDVRAWKKLQKVFVIDLAAMSNFTEKKYLLFIFETEL